MKKLITIFTVILLVILLAVPTLAAESAVTEGESINDALNATIGGTEQGDFADTPKEDNTADETVFGVIYSAIAENSDKIFSALSFIGTIVVAFFYKKGLMPLLNKALLGLGNGVSSVREVCERSAGISDKTMEQLKCALDSSERSVEAIKEGLMRTEERLCELSADATERARLNTIMNAQIDLLYEVFMSSSLPQYAKDSVGERVKLMREKLQAEASDE
jgi:hypothetical protein